MTNIFLAPLITIILELPLSLIFIKQTRKKVILTIIAINLITNPAINFIFNYVKYALPFIVRVYLAIFLEIIAVIIEAKIIERVLNVAKHKAFTLSFFNNLISAGSGMIFLLIIINILALIARALY